jgi:hypothetical protein
MNDAVRNKVAEDMAIARTLAEQGRRAPLVGGAIYVVWGVSIAICLGLNWAIDTRLLPVSHWAIPAFWFGGMTAAGVITGAIRARLAGLPGVLGIGNAVTRAAWNASGIFLGLFSSALFATMLFASKRVLGFEAPTGVAIGFAFSIFLPVSFGVYAIAMSVSAEAAQSVMLRRFSGAAFVAMIVTAVLIGRSEQMLVGAAAALIVLSGSGVALIRHESKR